MVFRRKDMNNINYLEMLPISSIAKYTKGQPNEGVAFAGYPRVHPSDKTKLILVNDPLGNEPTVLEFKLEDILFVEEIPSAVTENGEGVPLVKLWVKRGAVGIILEPFEVNDPIQFAGKVRAVKERILQYQPMSKTSTQANL
jgi:inorganic pyrophosphatase